MLNINDIMETINMISEENLDALMAAIVKAKPASTKGQYIKSCVIATTMGPGIKLNVAKFGA